jgi:Domain of unknown function (DUF4349)
MTMLDDDRLASFLADAAHSFDVPADGPTAIIARVRGAGSSPPETDGDDDRSDSDGVGSPTIRITSLRRAAGAAQRHRLVTVAACVVVLLVALASVGALTRPTSAPTASSLASRGAATHVPSQAKPVPSLLSPSSANTTSRPPYATSGTSSAKTGASGAAPYSTETHAGGATSGPSSSPSLPNGAVGQSSRIEQSGTLTLTVRRGSVSRTVSALSALAGANGGFVANSQTNSGANVPGGSVTLEVPVDSFATVLKQAEGLGRASGVSTKATDVTGQYVDLQARIGALQSSRQQYLTIMTRATTIGDVLSVQEQIDTIQSQIEQLQGQLQVLTNETAYSTLTATVNPTSPPPPPSPVPESGLVQAWHQSVGGFVDGVDGVVRLTGPTLFALVCFAGVLVGGRLLWRRYRRHSL